MKPRELYEMVRQYGAETCYMLLDDRGHFKNKTIITVETPDNMSYLMENLIIMKNENEISFIDTTVKLFHICRDPTHLVAQYKVRETRQTHFEN